MITTTIVASLITITLFIIVDDIKRMRYLKKNRNLLKIRNNLINDTRLLSHIFELDEEFFTSDEYFKSVHLVEKGDDIVMSFTKDENTYLHLLCTKDIMDLYFGEEIKKIN